jgi:predicted nucleic acid-binding protein
MTTGAMRERGLTFKEAINEAIRAGMSHRAAGAEPSLGNLVGDAHLAALALEHGATVASFDRDFARFEGVKLRRPD